MCLNLQGVSCEFYETLYGHFMYFYYEQHKIQQHNQFRKSYELEKSSTMKHYSSSQSLHKTILKNNNSIRRTPVPIPYYLFTLHTMNPG